MNQLRTTQTKAARAKSLNPGATWLATSVFVLVSSLLAIVQLKPGRPLLIIERLMPGWGWAEILVVASYAALVAFNMHNPRQAPVWRKHTWTLFSVVFFGQLLAGVAGLEQFLMTGRLHLPVPAMILAGPLYRGDVSVMTLLFLSTILLSGPAWCSHLCYFGAIDNLAAGNAPGRKALRHKTALKATGMVATVIMALALRRAGLPSLYATILGAMAGFAGLFIVATRSRKMGSMVHCITYCPVGTLVNMFGRVNPFRMMIDGSSCTSCMACSRYCRYDALRIQDIRNRMPGYTCTCCGDCLPSCHAGSIRYRFFSLPASMARNLYLIVTVSLHAVFLALARI